MIQETKDEKIEQLEQAQEKINEAVELIKSAVKDTNMDNECESYIIGHLENWAEGLNQYDYTSIPKLIKRIENYEEDEDEE
ncbi:MAG: hypothetical protein ACOCVF_02970 [bacterium]